MKFTQIIFCFFLLSQNYGSAQVLYENFYQDNGAYAGYAIKPTTDNGYIITGFCNPTGTFSGQEFLLIKIDSLGNSQWSSYFGDIGGDQAYGVTETSDGGFALVGSWGNPATSSSDIALIKTDANGNFQWQKLWGDTLFDAARDIVEIPTDSGFALAANFPGPTLIRTDKYGDTLWTKSFPDTAIVSSITLLSDGGFLLVGETSGMLGVRGYVVRTDVNGNEIWTKYFVGGGGERLFDGYETSDNRFIVVGSSLEDSPPPKPDGIIRILNINGDLLNYETYGGSLSDYFRGVCPTTDNNGSVIVGSTYYPSTPSDQDQFYIVKTGSNGELIWEVDFGNDLPETDNGYGICQSSDGGYTACGQKTTTGQAYLCVIKINEYGSVVSVNEISLNNEFNIYPNPCNNHSVFQFAQPLNAQTELIVYSIKGDIVFTDVLEQGAQEYTFYKNNLTPATYVVTIKTCDGYQTQKLIIY